MHDTTRADAPRDNLMDLLLASSERQRDRLAALRAAVEANDAEATSAQLLKLREISVDEAALMVSCAIAKDAGSALAALGEGGALAAPVLLATRSQEPPLLAAAKSRCASCMAVLLEHGAEPELSAVKGSIPIFDEHPLDIAFANGDAECARLLLPKANMSRQGSWARPPLMIAAESPNAECLAAALAWDNPNKRRSKGRTILASLWAFADSQEKDDPRSDALLLTKIQSLAPLLEPSVWDIGAPPGGWAARLASSKAAKTLAWMARSNLGFKPDANSAISNWAIYPDFRKAETPLALSALDAMLPRARLRDEKKAPLPKVIKEIRREIEHAAHAGHPGQRFDWLWAVADRIAAFDPLQPGAETLWELAQGHPSKTPRLNAVVEAKILQDALVGAAPAHDSSLTSVFPAMPARSGAAPQAPTIAEAPRAGFAEQSTLDLKAPSRITKRL